MTQRNPPRQTTPRNRAERRAAMKSGSSSLNPPSNSTGETLKNVSPDLGSLNLNGNQNQGLPLPPNLLSLDPLNIIGTGGENAAETLEELAKKERAPKFKKLQKDLARLYVSGGLILAMLSPQDGIAVAQLSEELASAWVDAAEKNAKLYAALNSLVEDSVYLNLAAVHGQLAAVIMQNHNVKIDAKALVMKLWHRFFPPKSNSPVNQGVRQPEKAPQGYNVPIDRDNQAAERLFSS